MGKAIELWLLSAVLNFARTEDNVIPSYFTEGDNLTLDLRPTSSDQITSILWKFNNNLLADWVKDKVALDFYSTFKGRTALDIKTGRLVIDKMTKADMGVYSVEINSKVQTESYKAIAIKKVPQPVIIIRPLTCTQESDSCILNCNADIAEAEPVTYSWKTENGEWKESPRDKTITKTEHRQEKTFTCRIKNPVSVEDSKSIDNPLYSDNSSKAIGISLGVLLFISIILASVFGAWKLKKGPFRDRGNDGTVSAPHELGQPSSNAREELTKPLNEKSADRKDEGGEDV